MASAFLLLQHVDLTFEFGVRGDAAGLGDDHSTTDLVLFNATQEHAHVVAGLAAIEEFLEHLHTRAGAGHLLLLHPDDLEGIAGLHDAGLDTASGHSTASGDGEHVLHAHQQGLLGVAGRDGDPGVHGIHQLHHALHPLGFAVQGAEGAATDHRGVVTVILIEGKQLAHFHLNEVKQFGVVDEVDLVHEDHDLGHAHLTTEQDMLAGLGHGAIGSGHHEDGTVHLGGTRHHVLHIVGVARTIHVCVVTALGRILHV